MFPTGYALGTNKVSVGDTLLSLGHTDPDKSIKKTGPQYVWHVGSHETTASLGIQAIDVLKEKSKIKFSEVELLISVTETPDLLFPGNASKYASNYNIRSDCELFDLNSGCTGFLDAFSLVMRLNKKALIVCSEAYSLHMNKFERSTFSLFSDGAAAVYIDPSHYTVIDEDFLYVPNTETKISSRKSESLVMAGAEVFQFTQKTVMPFITHYLDKHEDVAVLFVHQGSLMVVNQIAARLKARTIEIPSNVVERGNLVSATLPVLMDDYFMKSKLKGTLKFLLVGFGVGLQARVVIVSKDFG